MTAATYLIGLVGAAGAGKDSCAAVLAQYGWAPMSFADALRAEVAHAWDVDQRLLTNRHTKELPLPALAIAMCSDPAFVSWAAGHALDLAAPRSPRWVMQHWGTEYRRTVDPNYWVCSLRGGIVHAFAYGTRSIVVTDVRFLNEWLLIKSLAGVVLRVHRFDLPDMPPETAAHASEQHQLETDAVIANDGSLDQLHEEVLRVVRQVLGHDAIHVCQVAPWPPTPAPQV